MHLGSTKDDNILISMLTRLEPIMTRFAGPIEPLVFAVLMEIALFGFCTTGQVGEESCTSLTDAFDGLGSNQLESVCISLRTQSDMFLIINFNYHYVINIRKCLIWSNARMLHLVWRLLIQRVPTNLLNYCNP